jgi:hypothetical protein
MSTYTTTEKHQAAMRDGLYEPVYALREEWRRLQDIADASDEGYGGPLHTAANEAFDAYQEAEYALDFENGCFQWSSPLRHLSGICEGTLSPEQVHALTLDAESSWRSCLCVTSRNGFGEIVQEGVWIGGSEEWPIVLTMWNIKVLRRLDEIGQEVHIA